MNLLPNEPNVSYLSLLFLYVYGRFVCFFFPYLTCKAMIIHTVRTASLAEWPLLLHFLSIKVNDTQVKCLRPFRLKKCLAWMTGRLSRPSIAIIGVSLCNHRIVTSREVGCLLKAKRCACIGLCCKCTSAIGPIDSFNFSFHNALKHSLYLVYTFPPWNSRKKYYGATVVNLEL